MARAIQTHLIVQAQDRGFRPAPAVLVLTEGGGQNPQVFGVNDLPGPWSAGLGFENTADDNGWRAYDRAIQISTEATGVGIWAWQQNQIWGLTAPPNWTSVMTVADQTSTLDYGLHTGLYHVTGSDGNTYLCGLFRRPGIGAGLGWVKYDARTDTWSQSSGAIAGTPDMLAFGRCATWRGKLYLCAQAGGLGRLVVFDPAYSEITILISGLSFNAYSKPFTMGGRLFVATDTGTIKILELVGAALVNHGAIATESHATLFGSNGDFGVRVGLPALGVSATVLWYCSTGGIGHRAHSVTLDGPVTQPGNSLTIAEITTVVPDGTAASEDALGFTVDMQYPDALAPGGSIVSFAAMNWIHGQFDFTHSPLFSVTPGSFVLNQLNLFNNTNRFGFGETQRRVEWKGASTVMQFVVPADFAGGANPIMLSLSQVTDYRGGQERTLFQANGFVFLSAEPYADGTITRGMLIKFLSRQTSPVSPTNMQIGYSEDGEAPQSLMTLSAGDGIPIGGVASFNSGLNRLEDVVASLNSATPGGPSTTLLLTSVVGVFVAETITGGTSGATASVLIVTTGAIYVGSIVGAFTIGETITGGTSGSTATVFKDNTLQLYQVIWDLDTDGVPNGAWTSIQTTQFAGADNNPGTGNFYGSPTYGFVVQDATSEAPSVTGGAPTEISPVSAGSPPRTGGAPTEAYPLTLGSPSVTGGAPTEITEIGDYPPNLYARVPARAHSQPGWINFQTDGVGVGGDQPTANLLDSSSDASRPVGKQSGAAPTNKADLEISLAPSGSAVDVGTLVKQAVDLAAPGDTLLYTVPAGKTAVVFGASVRCVTATGVTVPATASLGFDGAAANLFSSQLLANLKLPDDAYDYPVGGEGVLVPAGSTILLRVLAAASGAQAGEATLFGYLL